MRQRAIAWLVRFLARWQDRYTLLDNHTARVRSFPLANMAAGAYRPVQHQEWDIDPDDYPLR